MDPALFLADLAEKPARLRDWDRSGLWAFLPEPPPFILLLGMGSSHYANTVAAARLRAGGVMAVAELASSAVLPRLPQGAVVIAVSASASSVETLDAVVRLGHPYIAVVNQPGPLADDAEHVVRLGAGPERGGVACRSYQHTLIALLDLAAQFAGGAPPPVALAAEACAEILDSEDRWLPQLTDQLIGPDGTYLVAPGHRISSAYQSALMVREGPRLQAVGCETGDWSHVDVYLTKTLDYRMALFPGSQWEPQLIEWTTSRGSTVVAIGGDVPGSTAGLRYRNDEVDDVRLLTETLYVELLSAHRWNEQLSR